MKIKQFNLILLFVFIMFTLSGCWDSQDINDKTLVTFVITDRENDQFAFYVETPNLIAGGGQEGGAQIQYQIVTGKGNTFAEARRKLDSKMDKPLFLGSVGSLIIAKGLAEYGIEEYMLRVQNMVDYRKVLNIATTMEKPDDLLSAHPEKNIALGYTIEDTVLSAKQVGAGAIFSTSDILEFIYSNYCYVLYNVDVVNGSVTHTGYSIMHNNKFLDFIPLDKCNGLVWLLAENARLTYTVPIADECTATIEVKLKNKKFQPFYKDGNLTYTIKLTLDAQVMYLSENIQFDKSLQLQTEHNLEYMIMQDIADIINKSKNVQCDFLGFKEQLRMKYPDAAKVLKWPDAFIASSIHIHVNCNLDPGGKMDYAAQGKEITNE